MVKFSNSYEERKGVDVPVTRLDLKIHTNIDEDYEIHTSEPSSAIGNKKCHNYANSVEYDTQNTGYNENQSDGQSTVIINEGLEADSNPIANISAFRDCNNHLYTHETDVELDINKVIEVNQPATIFKDDQIQLVQDNGAKRLKRTRGRHTLTLGGEVKYNEQDYFGNFIFNSLGLDILYRYEPDLVY